MVTTDWLPLLQGEFFVETVDIQGWRMLVESFEGGGHTFPRFVSRRDDSSPGCSSTMQSKISRPAEDEERGRSFVTTVQHLRAHEGEFVYEDHGSPWSLVARNIDLTMNKGVGYGGYASFDGGTVQIKDFEPMTATWESTYALDGGLVSLTEMRLEMDGVEAMLDGTVDLLNWPDVHGSRSETPQLMHQR